MRSLFLTAIIGVTACQSASRAEEALAPLASDHAAATVPHMIAVDVKLLEVARTKMRELGVDFTTFDGKRSKNADGGFAVQQVPSAASIGFIEALVKNRMARKIAEPKIAATSGREAQLSASSQSEASETEAGANEQAGIELRMTPTLLADGRVQVDLFVKYSWQEQATVCN
jgi:Flp pilus assembly secretin CpaC